MVKIFGQHDEATIEQLERCAAAEDGAPAVLCADGHLGYSMPIGGVVGYREHISPSGVGYDIACGNLAVRTTLRAADLEQKDFERIADQIKRRVSFGMGRSNLEPIRDHDVFDTIAHSPVAEQQKLLGLARQQLGTVGGGNHYVDILEDETGLL
jgi:tRNA-splicing ligase RtcB (3'-phosphate/5'-hydroxy nucleic acid ligase)